MSATARATASNDDPVRRKDVQISKTIFISFQHLHEGRTGSSDVHPLRWLISRGSAAQLRHPAGHVRRPQHGHQSTQIGAHVALEWRHNRVNHQRDAKGKQPWREVGWHRGHRRQKRA